MTISTNFAWGGGLVQWLKLLHWKVGNCRFEPHARLQVSKKQNVSSLHIRKDSTLRGRSVTERWGVQPQIAKARISNLVSGGQCHLIYLTILRRFSWPSLAYMCTKVAYMALQNGMRSLGPISLKRSYLYVQSFIIKRWDHLKSLTVNERKLW